MPCLVHTHTSRIEPHADAGVFFFVSLRLFLCMHRHCRLFSLCASKCGRKLITVVAACVRRVSMPVRRGASRSFSRCQEEELLAVWLRQILSSTSTTGTSLSPLARRVWARTRQLLFLDLHLENVWHFVGGIGSWSFNKLGENSCREWFDFNQNQKLSLTAVVSVRQVDWLDL